MPDEWVRREFRDARNDRLEAARDRVSKTEVHSVFCEINFDDGTGCTCVFGEALDELIAAAREPSPVPWARTPEDVADLVEGRIALAVETETVALRAAVDALRLAAQEVMEMVEVETGNECRICGDWMATHDESCPIPRLADALAARAALEGEAAK